MRFEVGDRVIGKEGTIVDDLDISGRIGTITDCDSYDLCIKFDIRFSDRLWGQDRKCWNVGKMDMEPFDPAEMEKRRKRQEELSLKHRDIDPFGEEIWEHVKRFKNYENNWEI